VTSLSDHSACATCGTSTLGLASVTTSPFYNDCGCLTSTNNRFYRLSEEDASGNKVLVKECTLCANGTAVIYSNAKIAGVQYIKNLNLCQTCPDPLMTFVYDSGTSKYSCVCPTGYSLLGRTAIGALSCVLTTLSSAYKEIEVEYSQVFFSSATIQSLTIQHYYTTSATACLYHGSPEDSVACQTLANLCVLQGYNLALGACATYLQIRLLRSNNAINGITNWPEGMPWLIYDGGSSLCEDKSIQMKMSLSDKLLQYVVSSYTLNGTWLGYRNINTLFNYCSKRAPKSGDGGGAGSSSKWQIFGAYQHEDMDCDLDSLLSEEQLFYELFLYDIKTGLYFPVPVRLEDLKSDTGSSPNAGAASVAPTADVLCTSGNVFVRRFMLYNIAAGVDAGSVTLGGKLAPKVIQFASFIKVEVSINAPGDPERILSPVLTIGYSESTLAGWSADYQADATYTFIGSYTMDYAGFEKYQFDANIAAVVFLGLMFFLRWFNWRRRVVRPYGVGNMPTVDSSGLPTLEEAMDVLLLLLHSAVIVGCPALALVTWYWFVFFKMQDTVAYMLPPQQGYYDEASPYFSFVLILHILAMSQLAYVIRMTFKQANTDIFFLDWEPAPKGGSGKKGKKDGGVSVWRTILVANEWHELAAQRRTDVRFTLFWVTFFLLGLQFEYAATQQPDLDDKSEGNLNIVLRFANTAWWIFCFTAVQWLWKYLVYERFISEPPEQVFVDMCTVAKVSLLLLDEPYHGYYLHCRSPHQFADGTMEELVEMLHKEEAGLTSDR
jgi:meckelin